MGRILNESEFLNEAISKSRKWVAGRTREEALEAVSELNRGGIIATVSFLGEDLKDLPRIQSHLSEYRSLIQSISASNLKANISVKPSTMGISLRPSLFLQNLEHLLKDLSKSASIELVVDSEGQSLVSSAYDEAVKLLRLGYEFRVTVACRFYPVIKAKLEEIVDSGGRIRITRGAYEGGAGLPFVNFIEDILELQRRTRDPILATNSVRVINSLEEHGVLEGFSGFETLLGKHVELERYLKSRRLRTLRYIPYGDSWIDYCARREKWFSENAGELKSILLRR